MKENAKINDFLNSLRNDLRELPANKREELIQEFYDHIYTEINKKIESGMAEDIAVNETIKNFDREQIHKINEDYVKDKEGNFEKGRDYFFELTCLFVTGGLFGLSLPILDGSPDYGLMAASVLTYIIGTSSLILYYGKRMNDSRAKWLQSFSKVLIPALSIPFILYVINLNREGILTAFPTIYLLVYVAFYLLTYFMLRRFYNKNRLILET